MNEYEFIVDAIFNYDSPERAIKKLQKPEEGYKAFSKMVNIRIPKHRIKFKYWGHGVDKWIGTSCITQEIDTLIIKNWQTVDDKFPYFETVRGFKNMSGRYKIIEYSRAIEYSGCKFQVIKFVHMDILKVGLEG